MKICIARVIKMDKNHKDKINTAIGLCEKRFSQFCTAVEARYTKEEASQIKYFLLQNSVFAGGVFRSTFTDKPVKDIDVFFTSLDASIEFQDRFMRPSEVAKTQKPLFHPTDITMYNTFNWYGNNRKEPPLSFITMNAGEPMELINKFDYSINQHYFDLNSYTMCFDIDTFSLVGQYNNQCETWKDKLGVLKRGLRFINQGFKIDSNSLINLVGQITATQVALDYDNEPDVFGSGGPETYDNLPLTGYRYTQDDYFGLAAGNVATNVNLTDGVTLMNIPHPEYGITTGAYDALNGGGAGNDWEIARDFRTDTYRVRAPNGDRYEALTMTEVNETQRNWNRMYAQEAAVYERAILPQRQANQQTENTWEVFNRPR